MINLEFKENTPEKVVIALQGELDTAAVDQYVTKLNTVMENAGREFVIDFSELQYISSAGMRILLRMNKDIKQQNGSLVIQNVSDDIRQIFQMTGFDSLFEIK